LARHPQRGRLNGWRETDRARRIENHNSEPLGVGMNNKLDIAVETIVAGIIAIFAASPDAATRRCLTIMVRSMFNWTRSSEVESVGFQVQQMVLMLMPDEDQSVVLHLFGQATDLFMRVHGEYRAEGLREWEARRQAARDALAARKAGAA
jgi:hypothetical protein